MEYMIKTAGLIKRYAKVVALAGLDLEVARGTVLGLLGPNGAGKTTAIRILTTLLEPDEGYAEVAGINVQAEPGKIREKIGLSGQTAAVDEQLTGYENLDMVGRLYHIGRHKSRVRARELLAQFELEEAADRPVKTYSGGMRRRLDLAAALVADPEVLFLDEPTTGLDPRSRAQMWQTIHQLVRSGSTVLLTTQYMEEADRLADKIVVIDHGRAIARGTPDELKTQIGGEQIETVLATADDVHPATTILSRFAVGQVQVDEQTRRLTVGVTEGADALKKVLTHFAKANIEVLDVGLRRPTLDDVFLSLTGHATEEHSHDVSPEGASDGKRKVPKRESVR